MKERKHSIEDLFILVTFLVYAMALLLFASLGATVYRTVTSGMQQHQIQRTAESYLREKIRQNDRADAIQIGEVEGQQALQITEQIKGKKYVTYIYADEGMLKELFISAEKEPKLQDGTALLEMQNLTFEEEGDGYLNIGLQTEQEKMHRFLIRKRSNSL